MEGLARRPGHLAPAEDVDMQVKDALGTMLAVIDNNAEAVVKQRLLPGDLLRREHELAQDALMALLGLTDACQAVPVLRNAEDVRRCLRRDIAEAQDVVCLVHYGRRDFAGNYLIKDGRRAIVHSGGV